MNWLDDLPFALKVFALMSISAWLYEISSRRR